MSLYENDSVLLDSKTEADGFEGVYDEEDTGVSSVLKIKSKLTIKLETINIDDIITSNFKKVSRSETLIGLSGVVGEWGVVTPIHVLKLEDENMYMLLDGLRRVFAALRNGKSEILAVVWDFEDKQEGKEKANILSLMINRSQKFSNRELWEQMQILEEVNGASPGLIEFLLQMKSGDAMKLKDVMLSDVEYSKIREDLMNGILTIDAAYRKLCNERKKENRLAKEDATVIEGVSTNPNEVSDEQHLSVDAVKEILDLTNVDLENETLESLDRSSEARGGEYVQDPDNRHPLDPALRQAVLIRDNFTCQCCGLGGEQRLPVLAVHHLVEVSQGGPDTMENLVVVCVSCHILIHTYAWGKLHVRFDELDENEKKVFKNVFKFGNIIIEADKRLGRTRTNATKEYRSAVRHPFPGEGLSENMKAFKEANKSE